MVVNKFPAISETFIVEKFLRLLDRGWDVHIVARPSDGSLFRFFPELEARAGIEERVTASNDMKGTLQALRPHLIHFEFGTQAKDLISLGRMTSSRVLVSFRGYDITFWALDEPGYYDEVWRRADLIHAVSSDIWNRAVARGCPNDKSHVIIPDAIDPAFFDPGERQVGFGIGRPTSPLHILSVGRLVWKKGYDYGLQAVAELVRNGIHCEYRIIGEGKERDSILYTIFDLGLEKHVKIMGARSRTHVRDEMAKADVFLHSSVSEGFGVSVIEAQAMELPVVCTDAEGLAENVDDGVTGFVVPRRDPSALAAKLTMLVRDADLRREMGRAGRRRVLEQFQIADQIAQFEDVYRQLIDVRYRAELLTRRLISESDVRFSRDEAAILRLAVSSGNRLPD